MSIWKYAKHWEATPLAHAVTMGEGATPLVRSTRIGPALGIENLWFKLEGTNPTGSYKDRFAAAAVAHLKMQGRGLCLGTSSGNTGAALAAYCARAGLRCVLAIVEGAPEGKLRQMRAYGAELLKIRGFGSSSAVAVSVMEGLQDFAGELDAGFEISAYHFSPLGMAGVETIGIELSEFFSGDSFDVFSPAGGGGLTLAVARGIESFGGRARVHCVQPIGNDTMATALREGGPTVAVDSKTAISGLQVGGVLDGDAVVEICRRMGGSGYLVADETVWEWQARLVREEGVFCEPAGAVALAGVARSLALGELDVRSQVVCLVTGTAFKDERSLNRLTGEGETQMADDFTEFKKEVRKLCLA